VLGILNLAIAELFMLGGYLGLSLLLAGYPLPVAVLGAAGGAALLGLLVEQVAYQPLRLAPPIAPLLSTLGFSVIFQTAATNIWGSDPLLLPEELLDQRFQLGPVGIGLAQLVVVGTAVLLVVLLAWMLRASRFGYGLRAIAENRDVARLLGVPAPLVSAGAFALSGGLAGIAGVLIVLHYGAITPYVGVEAGLKAIAVMVVGGTGNIWGVLLAGPLLGVLEVLTVAYGGAAFRDLVVYGLMILMLLLRPQGLLGSRAGAQRV
jgi:branched-chain amino acid transport system permease protein